MKNAVAIMASAALLAFASLPAMAKGGGGGRTHYGGGSHTSSHGGSYMGGSGSSHKNGTYRNPKGGKDYGTHK